MKDVQRQPWNPPLVVLCVPVLLWPIAALAAGGVPDVNQLKAELQAQRQRQAELEDKINQLEAQQKLKERAMSEKTNQATVAQETKQEGKKKEGAIPEILQWASRVGLYGDFRYRYEVIDDKSRDFDRSRNRIRARLGLNAKINDEWNLGFRLATGEGIQEGDPVSTNQTLGGSWGKKPFWLDLAFLDYHPQWAEGLDLRAGKMEFPFYKPGNDQLIWDSDLTPEGGVVSYVLPLGEKTTINLSAGGFWVVERSDTQDTALWGLQGYGKQQISGPTYVLGGASGYWYGNLQGEPALSLQWEAPTSNFFGNSNAGGVYTSEYNLLELFAELGTKVWNMPVAVFGDYVVNTAAINKNKDTGWLAGFVVSKIKDPGSWQFEYDYRDIQADAVVGQFNDSDFIGGGTGGRGHRFGFSYGLTKNVVPALNYYLASYEGRNNNADYNRLQADIVVKF
ncbi:MAG: putative porin [Planctomycetes bacterium]|nr:putative porin [Planctomycetota bacterium]